MRICCSVAVARKVFCRCNHTSALRALRKRRSKASYISWIFAVGTYIDHRIRGVVIYINNWSEDVLNSQGSSLTSGDFTLPAAVFRIASRADRHVPLAV